MSTEYFKFEGKSRFLVKLCNKSYGIKSRKQRIELYREKDAHIGLRSFSEAVQVFTRSLSEIKRFSTLGEIARFTEAK